MNPSIKTLAEIAEKRSRLIIGLMSGTSLDGLDIALCSISGSGRQTDVHLMRFTTVEYNDSDREMLAAISSVEQVELSLVCYQHAWLAVRHSEMILEALYEWEVNPEEVDCIASHGQTIFHYPSYDQKKGQLPLNSTLQIGDGDQIATRTGILTISDFRQKHIAHGGEGAPLAALVDTILFGDETENRVLLNIGGIANYTWIPAGKESVTRSFTTDTGPGNTLIDRMMKKMYDRPFDKDGAVAGSGKVNGKLLETLLGEPWFHQQGSKTTGPEFFNDTWLHNRAESSGLRLDGTPPEDLIATLTELAAVSVTQHILTQAADRDFVIYASGGGANNPVLVKRITSLLGNIELKSSAALGIHPDAKEAVIFAVLANEMLAGEGFDFEGRGGSKRNVNLGKISFPD